MPELIEFEWGRCPDGYELVRPPPRLRIRDPFPSVRMVTLTQWTVPGAPNLFIKAKSARFERYRPLDRCPVLFDRFSKCPATADGMLAFCNEFGFLGTSYKDSRMGDQASIIIGDLLAHHEQMRSALSSFERGNSSRLVEACNEGGLAASRIELRKDRQGRLSIVLAPLNLIQAMWLQFARYAGSETRLMRCASCNGAIIVGPGTGKRNTSKYCSDACRVAAFKARKRSREGADL